MHLATLFAAALFTAGFTPGSATETLLAEARISHAQARAAALRACAGSVIADSLERVTTGWVYSFEIRPILPTHGLVVVRVDARDGTIAAVLHPGDRR